MEAPWVRNRSKLSSIKFEQQPPRLVRWGFHASPLDALMIGLADDGLLCRIEFARNRKPSVILAQWQIAWPRTTYVKDDKATLAMLRRILGKGSRAQDVPLRMTGTKFQLAVWKELLKVPAGETVSYAELARRIKNPKAIRAVGNAMGANPVPILVPCHRVIASSGKIGGFGGGLALKRRLLAAENTKLA